MIEYLVASFYTLLFVAGLINTRFSLLYLPIFIFAYPNNLMLINFPFGIGLDELYILLLLIIQLVRGGRIHGIYQKKYRNIQIGILVLYGISNFYGFLIHPSVNIQLFDIVKSIISFSLIYLSILIYLKSSNSDFNLDKVKLSIIYATTIQAIIAILVFHYFDAFYFFYDSSNQLLEENVAWRATGSLSGPWELGGFLVIGSLIILHEISLNSSKSLFYRLLLSVCLVLMLYALVISTSRASYLFLAIGSLIILKNKFSFKLIIYSLLGLSIAYFIFPELFASSFELIEHRINYTFKFNNGKLDNSSSSRLVIWQRLYDNFSIFQLPLGSGWKIFQNTFGTTPHNGYLSIMTSSGILGVIVYYSFFKNILVFNRKINDISLAIFPILAIIAGLSFYSLTTDTVYTLAVFKLVSIIGAILGKHLDILTAKKSYAFE